MQLQRIAETTLSRLATVVFPVILLGAFAVASFGNFDAMRAPRVVEVPLRVAELGDDAGAPHTRIAALVQRSPARMSAYTDLSTAPFGMVLNAEAPEAGSPWSIDFPSRHAMEMECWDLDTGARLGGASRDTQDGLLRSSRGGFAIEIPAAKAQAAVVCTARFRGPARLTAEAWEADSLMRAQVAHTRAGAMIDAGLGLLALAMVAMAIINRSRHFSSLAVWLLLSMRMASLSAGTDFSWMGMTIPADWLVPMRQWTVCMYSVATLALFSQLFRGELAGIGSHRSLTGLQIAAIALLAACPLLRFEQILPVVWISSTVGTGIILYYLYRILIQSFSAVALWYGLSIVITLLASLNEVIAAAVRPHSPLGNLNSVSAALASALFVFAAAAEHMRSGRQQMMAAQQSLKTAYDDSPVGLFTLHDGDRLLNSNPAFRGMLQAFMPTGTTHFSQLFGIEVAREIQRLCQQPLPATIELQTPLVMPGPGASASRWFALRLSTHDGQVVEGSLQDISEKVLATQRLEFLVNHDPLTECLNLRGLSRFFERSHRSAKALAYLDLDRFKLINDLYGHAAGDAVLRQVCERIRGELGSEDRLARVGGDEFVITFSDVSLAAAKSRCQMICALISSQPFRIDAQRFALSISAGLLATDQLGRSSLKEMVSAADTLCRMAKKRPTERLVVMESGSTFLHHHKVELELISCLERGETPHGLFLLMQPELSLSQPFDSLNFEALVRMRKPDGGIIPASVIIEAAEAHSKTAIIDMWVMNTLIDWLETHRAQLVHTQFVGVNLSGGSLNDESFVEALIELLEQHPRVVPMLCVEITETVALTDMQHMQRLIGRLQSIGAKVGLDDFGAGYSSFGYLKGLSVDALKLDGSLVKDAAKSPAGVAILGAVAGLVRNLGMKSVGEFAEDLDTIKALVAAGVDYAQGYGISKPVVPERILAARSAAQFIEDPSILAYISQLQTQAASSPLPIAESDDTWLGLTMH